jgi:hypothetical protein
MLPLIRQPSDPWLLAVDVVGAALPPTLLLPFSRHLEGAGPDSSLGGPSSLLGSDVGLGVLAIGHSPSLLHEFVVQAHGADKALSDGASVLAYNSLLTPHRLAGDQIIQLGDGLLAAAIIFTLPLAKLTALRSVNAVEPYSHAPNRKGITVDYCRSWMMPVRSTDGCTRLR